jgi:hypothetical protein
MFKVFIRIIKMQRHIDELEHCIENLVINITTEGCHPMSQPKSVPLYHFVSEFLYFLKTKHPEIFQEWKVLTNGKD